MLRIIVLSLFIYFWGAPHGVAQVLTKDSTFRRGSLEIDLRGASSVLVGSSLDKANEIFGFFDEKISPNIPDALKNKITQRWIKIEFEKDLEKGALFIDHPNKSEPLILRVRSTLVNDPTFFRLLTHEWFHALHYVVHPDEPSWVREGLAQVFESIVLGGYNGPNLIDALERSTTRLDYDFKIYQVNREAYGHTFLYFYYLYQKCGKQDVFWKMVEQGVEFALSQMVNKPNYCSDFKTSVVYAELARFHNRKVKSANGTTDEYFIIPELNRSIKNVLTANDILTTITTLERFEPKILQASAAKGLSKDVLLPGWSVYTLGQSTPYEVRSGVSPNSAAMPSDLIFVMKTQ